MKKLDKLSKTLIAAASIILVFAVASPIIFTSNSINQRLNFNTTGEIGDTIGGIMNPFIGIVGVIATFLAFYVQILANKQSIIHFNKGIRLEREKEINKINEENKSLIKLLHIDFNLINTDIQIKIEQLNQYINKQSLDWSATNILSKSPIKIYKRINELDRLSIFKAFNIGFNKKDDWEKVFSSLFNLSSYYYELFTKIYETYDYHSKDIFNQKKVVIEKLISWRYQSIRFIDILKHDDQNAYSTQIRLVLENGLIEFERQASFSRIGQNEINLNSISEMFANDFLPKINQVKNKFGEMFPERMYKLLENISEIINSVSAIEFDNRNFNDQLRANIARIESAKNGTDNNRKSLEEIIEYLKII